MRYLRETLCATAAATMTLALAAPALAAEAAPNYVALGDSYSSGVGSREYFEDSGDCLRSPKSYAQLWADANGAALTFNACSGATTDDVNADQLSGLGADTTLVTISVGGNDVGFSGVVQDCLLGSDDSCDSAVSAAEEKGRSELPGKLDTTYANIKQAAPNAQVVVLGYPRLNQPTGDCGIPGFSEAKRQRINAGADVLAGVISERAEAAGFTFADPREVFDGHGVCSDSEWINGPSNPLQESFHPNASGYSEGYLPTLTAAIG
ncbi:SGNH/GDSL hydrolase family protein [Saccharopolyspora taberi]|uniref:SGNH family lipase n=1 Tax=Saccharopolyspora taberi TaxID=60895 RepID=A0ABN3VBK5_9PSEU